MIDVRVSWQPGDANQLKTARPSWTTNRNVSRVKVTHSVRNASRQDCPHHHAGTLVADDPEAEAGPVVEQIDDLDFGPLGVQLQNEERVGLVGSRKTPKLAVLKPRALARQTHK